MRVNTDLVKAVAFVCVKRVDGTLSPMGTAFFLGALRRQPPKFQMYVVTARHVLEGIRDKTGVDAVYITYNDVSGRAEKRIHLCDWHFHPGPSTEYVDVAVARFADRAPISAMAQYPSADRVRCWPMESVVTVAIGTQKVITPGQDVGIAGLFVHHQGSERNIPIVRCGSIAAMPTEPVSTKKGLITALLVEVRSVGGLSGSPVFAISDNQSLVIGLVHGHFDQRSSDPDVAHEDLTSTLLEEKINAGIAIVVPGDKIRETLQPLINADLYTGVPS